MTSPVLSFMKPTIIVGLIFAVVLGAERLIVGDRNESVEVIRGNVPEREVETDVSAASPSEAPSPKWSPQDVIQIQLAGLSDPNDASGISRCFRFASPANQALTGPVERFGQLVNQHPYRILREADDVIIGQPRRNRDGRTQIVVTVISRDEAQSFVWLLSKQRSGGFSSCWLTDSVIPIDEGEQPRDMSEAI